MEKLPRDALDLIVGNLADARDLCSCDCAAKIFEDLQWSSLVVRKDLQNLDSKRCNEALAASIQGVLSSRHTHALQELLIHFCNVRDVFIGEELDWTGLEGCRVFLRVLDLSLGGAPCLNFWNTINRFPSLSALKLNWIRFRCPGMIGISLSFPSLTKISLINVQGFSFKDVMALQTASPGLESLVMRNTDLAMGIDDVLTIQDAQGLTELVCTPPEISYGVVRIAGPYIPPGIPYGVVRLAGCNRLQKVEISFFRAVELSGSVFSALRHLKLREIQGMSSAHLSDILANARVLDTLVLASRFLRSPLLLKSSTLKTITFTPRPDFTQVLHLECEALQTLSLEGECLLSPLCGALSKLLMSENWYFNTLEKFLSLGFIKEGLTHLDMSTLSVLVPSTKLVLEVVSEVMQGNSCLTRVDVPCYLNGSAVDLHLAHKFVLSSFNANTRLKCLRLCVPKEFCNPSGLDRLQFPGLDMKTGEEETFLFYMFHPAREAPHKRSLEQPDTDTHTLERHHKKPQVL